jgi:outer membrane protein TolC
MREPTHRTHRAHRTHRTHRTHRAAASAIAIAIAIATLAPRASAQEATVTPITFEEAIKRATAHNPTAELATEEVRRSEALVQQARSTWYPTLTGNATYTRLDADRTLQGRVIQGANSLNANLVLLVPIVSPQAWSQSARVKEGLEVAKLTAEDTKKQVAIATGRAYLTVVAQHRVLDSAQRARDTAKAHEDFAKARLAGGVGNRLDSVRASQERATSDAQLEQQRIALTRAEEALGVLVGDGSPVDTVGEPSLGAAPTLQAALAEAESRRSDVVAQRSRVEVQRKFVRDAYVDYLPSLALMFQPFYQNPQTLVLPTTGWQAQAMLSVPLYDGGNRYGKEHERDALYDEARTKLDATLRQARSDVRIAFEAVRRADEALTQAREAAKLATEALELAELAYKAGATSNLEVVDAERRAHDADTTAAIAEDTARQARLDLLAASGRFP